MKENTVTQPPNSLTPREARAALLAVASLVLEFALMGTLVLMPVIDKGNDKITVTFLEILCVVCFIAVPILGVASLVANYRSGGHWFVRVIACLSLLFWSGQAPALVCSIPETIKGRRLTCGDCLHKIGEALEQYSKDHDHHYPATLGALYPKYISDLTLFHCPDVKGGVMQKGFDERLCSYRYLSYPDDSARAYGGPKHMLLAFDRCSNHRKPVVHALYSDGHVEYLPRQGLICMLYERARSKRLSKATRDLVRSVLDEVIVEIQGKTKFN